ncbi:MAG: family 78 glycoside hydrolase catalytic domain [Bacteroidota bacterium]
MKTITFLLVLVLSTSVGAAQQLAVTQLTCEYKSNPAGIDKTSPKLAWQLQSTQRNVVQAAYRILVADDPALLKRDQGNKWDSKKVNSNESIQISYRGSALQNAGRYFWKVMTWDNYGNSSAWSEPASWQMGLEGMAAWANARWIGYEKLPDSLKLIVGIPDRGPKTLPVPKDVMPMLRKSFPVSNSVANATLFITGLGQFEASINGVKIGDHFLDPAWTQFDQEAMYVTFDVTKNLAKGENAIGVLLGNGFHLIPRTRYRKMTNAIGYPKMICRLLIEYRDGSTQNLVSDESWKAARSAITYSSIFGGEDYDARLEQDGWDKPGFDDSGWQQAIEVDGAKALRSQLLEPIKFFETFVPTKTTRLSDSSFVVDLGQNASGIPSITVKGKRGDTIRILPAELLTPSGTANQKATGNPFILQYVLKSDEAESWQPRFTYYGFRYLQVVGAVSKDMTNPAKLPEILEIKGLHMRNSAAKIGDFTCSSELFNKTYKLIDWSIKSNMQSVLTDCPHREKLGWLEQVHLMGNSIRYNYDVVNLLKKTVYDMMKSQTKNGLIPEISPEYVKFDWGGEMFRDSPEWGSTGIILPWYLYEWYGEKDLLTEAYPMMQRYINYLATKATNNILTQGLGDWYDLGPKDPGVSQLTTKGVTATAIYHYDLLVLTRAATLLGKTGDANHYKALAAEVSKAFNKEFFNPRTNQYATGSQTSNAMALYMDLVAPKNKEAVVRNLVGDLQKNNNALTAGDIGYRYLLRVLENSGRSDVIYAMNNRSDVPGYGYQLAKGATALTESWQALPTVSNNHLMLGHLMEWFYSGLAGIRQPAGSIAFKKIEIHPEPVGEISFAKASHQSPYGPIVSGWKIVGNDFELTISIPPNTTATIYLPAKNANQILMNGKPFLAGAKEQRPVLKNGKMLVNVGSGEHVFVVKNYKTKR